MSLFELKNKLAVDMNLFEKMKKTAVNLLKESEKGQYTQAVVLLSSLGNEYGAIIKDATAEEKNNETALLEKLKAAEDTEIQYILCMWKGYCIDISSYAFRKMLLSLNQKNAETVIFVLTGDNEISGIEVQKTMT